MKIDIGCGNAIRSLEHIGLDYSPGVGVTHVVNLERDRWPLPDRSVDEAFSSHCFEHIAEPHNLWSEISRVMKVGGEIIIYTPYPWSDDQHLNGHVTPWGRSRWDHVSTSARHFYSKNVLHGGYWRWKEVCYAIPVPVKDRFALHGIPLDMAIHHHINVVHEWGCFFEYTLDDPGEHKPLETYCHGRDTQRYLVSTGEPLPARETAADGARQTRLSPVTA